MYIQFAKQHTCPLGAHSILILIRQTGHVDWKIVNKLY